MQVIDSALRNEYRRHTCEWCRRYSRPWTEPHHIFGKGFGGKGWIEIPENLVALCRSCHDRHHYTGRPSRRELLAYVADREHTTPEAIVAKIHQLRRPARATRTGNGEGQAGPRHQSDGLLPALPPSQPRGGLPRVAVDQNGWHVF